jgi:hypothetical protein
MDKGPWIFNIVSLIIIGSKWLLMHPVRITMDLLADKFHQRHGETGGLTWSMTANLIQDYADRIDHRV